MTARSNDLIHFVNVSLKRNSIYSALTIFIYQKPSENSAVSKLFLKNLHPIQGFQVQLVQYQ